VNRGEAGAPADRAVGAQHLRDVTRKRDVVVHAEAHAPGHRTQRCVDGERLLHAAQRRRDRQRSGGVVHGRLAVDTARRGVERGRQRHRQPLRTLGGTQAPAREHFEFVGGVGVDDGVGGVTGAAAEIATEAKREGERGTVVDLLGGTRRDDEAVHEIELQHAGRRDPRAARVRRAIEQGLAGRGNDDDARHERG
jgi:hypothetical protein